MMKFYAGSMAAMHNKTIIEFNPVVVWAVSEDEAIGKILKESRTARYYPENEGWSNHKVTVMEVSTDMLSRPY